MRTSEESCDVTLVNEDQVVVRAHRVLLVSISSLFRGIFKIVNQPHPVIFLKEVKSYLVTFMIQVIYDGETNMSSEESNIIYE